MILPGNISMQMMIEREKFNILKVSPEYSTYKGFIFHEYINEYGNLVQSGVMYNTEILSIHSNITHY